MSATGKNSANCGYPHLYRPIDAWLVVIAGRTQRRGRPTGPQKLFADAHRRFSGPTTNVSYWSWSDNWAELAQMIARVGNGAIETEKFRVAIAGYSWGGDAAIELAARLGGHGIDVARLVLCDAVYRSCLFSLRWLSLTPWPTLHVPANVRRASWFYQRQNPLLHGHRVVAMDPKETRIDLGVELKARHEHMDDQAAWHRAVIEAFEEACDR